MVTYIFVVATTFVFTGPAAAGKQAVAYIF